MRMGLGLGLNQQQGGGAVDPYAAYDAAYDFRTASGYTLDTGKVSAAANLGTGGAGYDATQSVALDRPTIGAMTDTTAAAVFTSAEEWLVANGLATLMNSATTAARITIIFESSNLATQQCLLGWTLLGSGNDNQIIATDATGQIRLTRRNAAAAVISVDSANNFTTGTTTTLTLEFGSGLVSGFMNGVAAFTNIDYIGAVGALNCDTFTIGSRVTTAGALGWEGLIAFIGVELL